MEDRKFKYDFFISYKHGERDSKISGYLQKKLEGYKIPKEIKKRCGKDKITRVFRDREELAVTVDLTQEIEEQLKNTEYLVVMCSPQSKQSVWVSREVETFLKYRGWEYVLPVLIEGEPKDSFPEVLNQREMLAADVRGNTFGEIKRKCKNEILRLLAPALKCSYDELKQRNRAFVSRRIASIALVLAIVAAGFGVYAWKQSVKIQENYWQKLENQAGLLADRSMELLESGDREAALLVALEALPEYEGSLEKPLVGKAQIALADALYLYKDASVTAPRPVHTLKMDKNMRNVYALNDEKNILISCDEQSVIYVWNLESGELKYQLSRFYELEENCDKLLVGKENTVYICGDKNVISYDYVSGQVVWEIAAESQEFLGENYSIYWRDFELSPEKDRLAISGGNSIWMVDAKTGKLLNTYPITNEVWGGENVVWNPNGEELALSGGDIHSAVILLLDLNTGKERILKTFDKWMSIEMAYKAENRLTCLWTLMDNYSLGQFFSYADYSVAEIDCESGKTVWELTEQTVVRDSKQNIRYVCEEDDGEEFDLTVVTMGSEVITIRDGKLWSEFAYDSEVQGVVSYGLLEQHITESGLNYIVSLSGKFIMNDEYDTRALGQDEIYMAAGTWNKGIVAFPGYGGGTIYVYEPVRDENFTELENAQEATVIDYSPNRKYRIAKSTSPKDYQDSILNVWNMETGEHIFRQEFLYDSNSDEGDFLQEFGFLNDRYFYYCTYYDFVLVDVETLEIYDRYTHLVNEIKLFNRMDELCVVDGENPGAFFLGKNLDLYFYSVKDQTCNVILDSASRKNLVKEKFGMESHLYFTSNPTGSHLFMTCASRDAEGEENLILVWDVKEGKIVREFQMPFRTYNEFELTFSEDGTSVLFQNKAQELFLMHLSDCSVVKIPLSGESFQKVWFSKDKRYVYGYTYDNFLQVYDSLEQKQTLNLESGDGELESCYFEGDKLHLSVRYSMSQPVMYSYRETGEGVYDCYSTIYNCELITSGKVYLRKTEDNSLSIYPVYTLDEMITMAKDALQGRELTDVERQRYSID